jgi:hypothetical protein
MLLGFSGYISTLKMEAVLSSSTSVNIYQTTRYFYPEVIHICSMRNLNSSVFIEQFTEVGFVAYVFLIIFLSFIIVYILVINSHVKKLNFVGDVYLALINRH